MTTIAVIGAGQMGAGIAQVAAAHGNAVLLADIDLATAEKARAGIEKGLGKLVAKEKSAAADAEATLARITPVTDYAAFADAEFVIEAATEREDIKAKFKELVKLHHPDANGGDKQSEDKLREIIQAYNYLKQAGRV